MEFELFPQQEPQRQPEPTLLHRAEPGPAAGARRGARRRCRSAALLAALPATCLAFAVWGSTPKAGPGQLSYAPGAQRALPGLWSQEALGRQGQASFRRFFYNGTDHKISPWHDLPLGAGAEGEYWMVTEIPKMTRAKMEIATREPFNPIAQDLENGEPRKYHGPIYWNYGALPQTWEDPTAKHPKLGAFGDNDPLDVVEIGSRAHAEGEVVRVKVLTALAMIDGGELDWKVIVIATDDALASELHTAADVEARLPGYIPGIREWFRWYKAPAGKPLNTFGYGGKPLSRREALEVVAETHAAWQKLRSGERSPGALWAGASGS